MIVPSETEEKTPKLIDFNVSIKFEKGKQMIQKTGYLEYRAPELVEGGNIGYNESVDIWSTLAILYYMLSGVHAFEGEGTE
jgi:serine/threonine protein kinase